MATVFLGLGSNLGNRKQNIKQAIDHLTSLGVTLLKEASIVETEPVGYLKQGKFLNTVVKIETEISPHELLSHLKFIEQKLGRVKTIKDGPRTIDLDILLYDDLKVDSTDLTIPHPRMMQRDFVLKPLSEIEPELVKGLHDAYR